MNNIFILHKGLWIPKPKKPKIRIPNFLRMALPLSIPAAQAILMPATATGSPGKTDLISWWTLDETSGTRVDSHTTGNDLTDNNTVLYGTGKISNAADFETTNNEYLSHTDNASLSMGSADVWFSFWVKPESVSATFTLFSKQSSGPNVEYVAFQSSSTTWLFYIGDNAGGVALASVSATISAGTWYFLNMWTDKAGAKLYLQVNNGTPGEGTITGSMNGDSTAAFQIGGNSGLNEYYDGLIDEFGFFKNHIPTADERTWMYNSANGRTYSDL